MGAKYAGEGKIQVGGDFVQFKNIVDRIVEIVKTSGNFMVCKLSRCDLEEKEDFDYQRYVMVNIKNREVVVNYNDYDYEGRAREACLDFMERWLEA